MSRLIRAQRKPLIILAILGLATIGLFQNCGQQSVSNSTPLPEHGVTSPFATSKVMLTTSFVKGLTSKSSSSVNALTTSSSNPRLGAATASNPVIPAGSNLVFIVKDICLQNRKNQTEPKIHYFLDKYVQSAPVSPIGAKFDESAIQVALQSPILLSDLHQIGQTDACVIGVTNAQQYQAQTTAQTAINYNDPGFSAQQTALNQIGFANADAFFNSAIGSTNVTVAVIDTGFDLNNEDIGPLNSILDGSDIAGGSSRPQDTDGHGTQVASVITAQGGNGKGIVGIASRNTTLLPIRLLTSNLSAQNRTLSAQSVFSAIKLAVNAGAEVVNMSFTTSDVQGDNSSQSCDVLIGYAIYRGIEGGTFFTMAAGQWTAFDRNGNPIPGNVTAPKENGPLPVGANSSPACWGRYYKGAVSVGALQTGGNTLASFSNWGSDSIELAAPGTSIETYGLNNQLMQVSGTSISSAEVAAAAALVIAYHKKQGWPYSPWLIEDVLLNGSTKVAALASATDGRSVHGGRVLDLQALTTHLQALSSETQQQRLQEPSEDPETGVVFQAGNGSPAQGTLSKIDIYTDTPLVQSNGANRAQLQVVAYYSNASFQVITEDPSVTYASSDPTKVAVQGGIAYPVSGALGSVSVSATYQGVTASTTISLTNLNVLTGVRANLDHIELKGASSSNLAFANYLDLPDSSALNNYCPLPSDGKYLSNIAGVDASNTNAPVLKFPYSGVSLAMLSGFANYEDGTIRFIGSLFGSSSSAMSSFTTAGDGSTLLNDDVGGSQTTLTSLYRGKKTSLTLTHALLPATSVVSPQTSVTVLRGTQFIFPIEIHTSGSCTAFVTSQSAMVLDAATSKAKLTIVTNPVFAFNTYNSNNNFTYAMNFSSPQPALNQLIQAHPWYLDQNWTVGNALPAGTYTINGTLVYRGSGQPQTFNLPVLTLTLTENSPIAAVIEGDLNRMGADQNLASFSVSPASIGPNAKYIGLRLAAGLQLQDGTLSNASPESFTWTILDPSGNTISSDATDPNAKVWYDFDPTQAGIASKGLMHFNIFSGQAGDTYTVKATDASTGFSIQKQYTIKNAPIYHLSNTTAPPVPSLNNPSPTPPAVPANDGSCTQTRMSASPFAGGSGTTADPYLICTPTQFLAMGKATKSASYQIKQNLDFTSMGNLSTQPLIMTQSFALDGGGFEIQNFTFVDQEAPVGAIFSVTLANASIANLTVRNPTVFAKMAGSLIGLTELGPQVSISNVYVLGGTVSGGSNSDNVLNSIFDTSVGGIIGQVYGTSNVTLNNDFVIGTAVQSQFKGNIGGFIGKSLASSVVIQNSGSEVNIRNIGVPGSMSKIGGLIGDSEYQLKIVSSYSKGQIAGATDDAGGLVGFAFGGLILNSASSVEVISQGTNSGGLVGSFIGNTGLDGSAIIYGSIATGRVWGGQSNAGGSNAGGLVGVTEFSIIENSTAQGAVAGVANVAGFVGVDKYFNQFYNCSAQGAVSASNGVVGGFGGQKTSYDNHLLDGIYSGNTFKSAGAAYSTYLNSSSFTPAGFQAQ
jgi:hypothetical protein